MLQHTLAINLERVIGTALEFGVTISLSLIKNPISLTRVVLILPVGVGVLFKRPDHLIKDPFPTSSPKLIGVAHVLLLLSQFRGSTAPKISRNITVINVWSPVLLLLELLEHGNNDQCKGVIGIPDIIAVYTHLNLALLTVM